jgi:hypothetical protein
MLELSLHSAAVEAGKNPTGERGVNNTVCPQTPEGRRTVGMLTLVPPLRGSVSV